VSSLSSSDAMSTTTAKSRHRVHDVITWLEGQSLLIMALAVVAVVSLAQIPQHITQDTWLALVDGRYITQHGIPQHDNLFVITRGARWLDQQWLAQLALYGLNQVGGLALYAVVFVALTMAGFCLAIAAARALGGSERHILWVLPLAGFLYFAGSSNIRTQGFAYPLFTVTLWLLARAVRDSRDRRIYFVFPLLILWGNLHGSATLGAGLAMLAGAVLIAQGVSAGRWRQLRQSIPVRGLLLLVVSPICLMINPYGPAIVHYYSETILNPAFGKVVSEWQPITSSMVLAIPFFGVAGISVWLMGRSGRRMPAFDQLALLALAVGAVFAVRNVSWYGLGAMILLPPTLTTQFSSGSPALRHPRINLSLLAISGGILLVALLSVATRPTSWFAAGYDGRAFAAVSQIARQEPSARIYVDNRYADWLLWRDPALAGRMGYDIRFELLTTGELQSLIDATQISAGHEQSILNGYRVLVLQQGGGTNQRILARSGTHIVVHGNGVVVATWQPPT
jgi:MFS family permease